MRIRRIHTVLVLTGKREAFHYAMDADIFDVRTHLGRFRVLRYVILSLMAGFDVIILSAD